MERPFLLPYLLLAAVAYVSRAHETDVTALTSRAYEQGGGLLPLVVQQAVQLSTQRAELKALKSQVSKLRDGLSSLEQKAVTKSNLAEISKDVESRWKTTQGSTFVRWGRKSCPNDTTLVYRGYASTKGHEYKGGGTNYICLTMTPQFDDTPFIHGSMITGVEYEIPGPQHDHDMPCAVCRAPQAAIIMVPATVTCPAGWTPRYSGVLGAAHSGHYATEFMCLDSNPEHVKGGHKSSGAHDPLVYLVKISCSLLPCPPYEEGKVVTCVVCSQ